MTSRQNDIAVIGIGCRFPDADSSDMFFQNLIANKHSVGEIPRDRWSYADLYSTHGEEGRINSKWGGFISGVSEFDARFFKILPAEAEMMDPQQKLFLTCSWEALEDAGYARRQSMAGRAVGVFAGVTWNEFSLIANEYGYLRDRFEKANSLYWSIPNRVSYFFDFVGPSIAVDTACSSSLVAVHLASQALLSGECEMALAGAVNLNLHPSKYLFLSNSGFMSSEGKCRGFGEGGNGYVPSEGVAVLVLKTLSAAEAAGDHIYGVIKSTAINHGGKATGYTVPNPRAHQSVIQAALKKANVDPRDIGYVECHGTGTALGDPIELTGLKLAFEEATQDRQFCGIGTVKSNIGHCEATAGIAGLIKILHGMQAKIIPATLHAEEPNRHIDFENSPFFLVQENTPWLAAKGPLLAGLSSFGAGGSNGHCIVQEASKPYAGTDTLIKSQVVVISSLSRERTLAYCRALRQFLLNRTVSLADLCHTLRQRDVFEHRIAFVVESVESLCELLYVYAERRPDDKVFAAPRFVGQDSERLLGLATQWVEDRVGLKEIPTCPGGVLIHLPTYAFEKARSWIHDSPCLYRRISHPNPLHPLLDENSSTSTGGAYLKTLHRDEYFLDEHWVEGHPVLPGVCLVEMAASAAANYFESVELGLFDIWFLEPVALHEQDSKQVRLEISAAEGKGEGRFEVLSGERSITHATGKIRTGVQGEHVPRSLDLQEIFSRCMETITPDTFYRRFALSGIVQLGRFKVVTDFRFSASEAIAKLTLSEKFLNETRYGMNPTLLDGAVQTAMMHLYQRQPETETILPFQLGACVRHCELETKVVVVASLKSLSAKRYDIAICDEAGNVLVQLNDFVLREYKEKQHGEKQHGLQPLLFAVQPRELPPLIPAQGLDDGLPFCVVVPASASLLGAEDFPSLWAKVSWKSNNAPEADIVEFLATVEGQIPQIAIVFDGLPNGQVGSVLFRSVKGHANTLFYILQFLARRKGAAEVIVCVRGENGQSRALAQADLALLKCLNLELPNLRLRLLEIASDVDRQQVAAILTAEFKAADPYMYVRYVGGSRFTERLEELTSNASSNGMDSEPSAWIVTGAGGGLGMHVAHHLLKQGKRVVLLGRSALGDAGGHSLQHYSSGDWEYLQCDLTDTAQVGSAVDRAVDRFGDSWGIVHCAGKIEDGAFLKKDWTGFERVIRSKIESLLLLCEGLNGKYIHRIALFSSLTSLMGNKGQVDYGFANGFLDGFAALAGEMAGGQPIVSVMDWPYWEEGGMRISAEKLPFYSDFFLTQPLPTAVGCELLEHLLTSVPSRMGVIYSGATLEQVEGKLVLKPLLESTEAMPKLFKSLGVSTMKEEKGAGVEKDAIRHYLVTFLQSALKLELTESDVDLPLAELGVDSLSQMDLITKLEKQKRFEDIPQSLLIENATIASLVDFFYENHRQANYSVN